jgi:hypothetical protein
MKTYAFMAVFSATTPSQLNRRPAMARVFLLTTYCMSTIIFIISLK